MRSKNGGVGGTGVYMGEGTTSRVMAADWPYDEIYDFYSVRPEYFGLTLVFLSHVQTLTRPIPSCSVPNRIYTRNESL
jgi:hypothetical protein